MASPWQILLKQLQRLAERVWVSLTGTELEFMVFRDRQAWHKGYRNLEPANLYNGDYSLLGGGRIEKPLRRVRNNMTGAGMYVESAEGECDLGQDEIAFRADALTTCDNHSIYKMVAKEITAQEECSLSFMASSTSARGTRATSTSVSVPPTATPPWRVTAPADCRS